MRTHYALVFHIDTRNDGAQVLGLVQGTRRQAQAELLDMMDRRMV